MFRTGITMGRAVGVVALALGLTVGVAAPASADVVGTYYSNGPGLSFNYLGPSGDVDGAIASELLLRLPSGTVGTYCVQQHVGVGQPTTYTEDDWVGIPDIDRIAWILNNSVPNIDKAALEAAVGVTLSDYEAYGATQLAIWVFTDGFDFANIRGPVREQEQRGAHNIITDLSNIKAVVAYLTGPANVGSPTPDVTLGLDDTGAAWTDGRFGPIVVHTNSGAPVQLTLTGAPAAAVLENAAGDPVATAMDGDALFIALPPGTYTGTATLTADAATTTVLLGRLFTAPGAQSIVLAQSHDLTDSTGLDVTLTTVPLAKTGVDAGLGIAGALLLLLAGVLVVVTTRREPAAR